MDAATIPSINEYPRIVELGGRLRQNHDIESILEKDLEVFHSLAHDFRGSELVMPTTVNAFEQKAVRMTDVRDREPEIELVAEDTPLGAPCRTRRGSALLAGRARADAVPAFQGARGRQRSPPCCVSPTISREPRSRVKALIILSMLVVVLLPTVAAGVYLFAFASRPVRCRDPLRRP